MDERLRCYSQEELVDRVFAHLLMDSFFRLCVACKRWSSIVYSFDFLTDCSHVSSLGSSFSLLTTPASRPTFYGLSDPAPTSAPSKKIPLWDFPQGSVSLVSTFSFFSSCAFFWFLLLFSQLTGPSWRFIFSSPHPIPSFF